jgi:hypothetical protein
LNKQRLRELNQLANKLKKKEESATADEDWGFIWTWSEVIEEWNLLWIRWRAEGKTPEF